MIRLFSKLCKGFKHISSKKELNVFVDYIESISAWDLACPSCGAKHALSPFASYDRHFVTYDDDKPYDHHISITRYICSSCGHTHAILPPVIIPYMSFSFKFVISIIHDHLLGKFKSIEAMCKHYDIAISTFYRIFNKFKEHKKLWLGLLEDRLISDLVFIQELKDKVLTRIETFIIRFFNDTGLSFFQETS